MKMASLAFFFTVTIVLASVYAAPDEGRSAEDDWYELERKVLNKCNKDIKAPESAIEKILYMEDLDETKEGKCLLHCAMRKFGVMQEDGHMNEEKTLAYIKHAYTKPETQVKVKEISDLCIHRVEKVEDHCEHAFNYLTCAKEEARKNNIPKIHEEKQEAQKQQ